MTTKIEEIHMDGLIVASGNIVAVFIAAFFTARAAKAAKEEAAHARRIAEKTHTIVNNQRTLMLRAMSALAARVARDNPDDEHAQLAAEKASRDLRDAERASD
jgi:hypothetical protein